MKRLLSYALILPLLMLAACGERTDTDYTTDTDATYQQDDRHMRAELTAWLDDIDRNFEQLQSRAQETGEDWTSEIQDLRERRDEIRADLQQTGTATGTAGTTTQPGTDRTMGDDQYADDRRADGVAPGTTGETRDPATTTPRTTGQGYADVDYDRIRERMEDLDSDIEELRLKAITTRDEFLAEVDTRLNEIDRELESLTRRNGMADGYGTTTPGTADDRTRTDDRTMTGDPATTRDGTAYSARHDDVNVENLRDDRDDVREKLAELRAGETDFDSEHESLAEDVADLRARVKSASVKTGSSPMMDHGTQQSARVDRDVDV